jgi:hypothetical protein
VNALSFAALPEFANDEQLPFGRSYCGEADLKNVHVKAVNVAYKTMAVD